MTTLHESSPELSHLGHLAHIVMEKQLFRPAHLYSFGVHILQECEFPHHILKLVLKMVVRFVELTAFGH